MCFTRSIVYFVPDKTQTETKLSDKGPIAIGNSKVRVDHALQMELVPLSVLETGLKLVPECFIAHEPLNKFTNYLTFESRIKNMSKQKTRHALKTPMALY